MFRLGAPRRMTAGIVAAAFAVTLGLGGCAGNPKMAAQVGTRTITAAELERAAEAMTKINPRLGAPGLVLSVKMRAAAAEQIATSRGLDLEAETDRVLPQLQIPPQLMTDPEGRTFVRDVVKVDALGQKMGPAELASAMGFLTVRTNPRYGVPGLEDVANQEAELGNGSLSIPAS